MTSSNFLSSNQICSVGTISKMLSRKIFKFRKKNITSILAFNKSVLHLSIFWANLPYPKIIGGEKHPPPSFFFSIIYKPFTVSPNLVTFVNIIIDTCFHVSTACLPRESLKLYIFYLTVNSHFLLCKPWNGFWDKYLSLVDNIIG